MMQNKVSVTSNPTNMQYQLGVATNSTSMHTGEKITQHVIRHRQLHKLIHHAQSKEQYSDEI
jgi:hypothetical protein